MPKQFRCELVSFETVYDLAYRLAGVVHAAGYRPDMIVAIARGGFVPARLLCDFLGVSDMCCIKIQHYAPGACKQARAEIKYPLAADIKGRRVLIADDVNDTGDTLATAIEHVAGFEPESVRTAVLHEKETSTTHADFLGMRVAEWRWLIYPWAVTEDLSGFLRAMDEPPADLDEAAERLHEDYELRVAPDTLERVLDIMDREMA